MRHVNPYLIFCGKIRGGHRIFEGPFWNSVISPRKDWVSYDNFYSITPVGSVHLWM